MPDETNDDEKPKVVPKLIGFDGECGNFLVGGRGASALAKKDEAPTNHAASPTYYGATGYLGGTDDRAASMLLRNIRGVTTELAKKRDAKSKKKAAKAAAKAAKRAEHGSDFTGGMWYRDYGRKWLTNGGCAYIDCAKLELCTPIVRSALEHVKYTHALFRMTRRAAELCREDVEKEGKSLHVILNNSDGHGNSWGTHVDMLVTRDCWDNIFERKLQYLLYLASYQVTSVIFTGQGKVGKESESGFSRSSYGDYGEYSDYGSSRASDEEDAQEGEEGAAEEVEEKPKVAAKKADQVDFQISQRADYFKCMVGGQTTFNRPIVNSRNESLCGAAPLARMHIIFYDQNLCHTAAFLKVGVLQIILAMIEARFMNPNLLLDDPLRAVKQISRDPSLTAKVETAGGERLTAVDIQFKFLEDAKRFHATGQLDGIVPMADKIIEQWEEVLTLLRDKDFDALAGKLDWVLKKALLERAIEQNGLEWDSPEIKALDHKYADVSEDGLYFTYEKAGVTDQLVSEEEVQEAMTEAPVDTRSWLVGDMLKRQEDGEVEVDDVDWDEIEFKFRREKGSDMDAKIQLDNPLEHTKADCEAILEGPGTLEEKLTKLGLEERTWKYSSTYRTGAGIGSRHFPSEYPGTYDDDDGPPRRHYGGGAGGQSWSDTEYYKDRDGGKEPGDGPLIVD